MRDPNEYRNEEFQDIDCFFCKKHIALKSNADLDALDAADLACELVGCIQDLDDLGEGEGAMSVCPVCAERLVGPDWLEKGRALRAQNDAWLAAGGGTCARERAPH